MQTTVRFATINEALEVLKMGKPIIVMDDEDRENEGDLVMAAQFATEENVAFFLRHTTGILCAPMAIQRAQELSLPLMVSRLDNTCPKGTAFTVSVDAKEGTTTGVSASDRAVTLRKLADPSSKNDDFIRPGHVFPLQARDGGVLVRRGHTEASLDLCRLAGLQQVALIGELMDHKTGRMRRLAECWTVAQEHDIPLVTIEHLARHLEESGFCSNSKKQEEEEVSAASAEKKHPVVELVAECVVPVERDGEFLGKWSLKLFKDDDQHSQPHTHIVALVKEEEEKGAATENEDPELDSNAAEQNNNHHHHPQDLLVRVHSECFTGNTVGSRRCDCNDQLSYAMKAIAREGRGVVLYVQGHEGRGIGLINKIRAYLLQTEVTLPDPQTRWPE